MPRANSSVPRHKRHRKIVKQAIANRSPRDSQRKGEATRKHARREAP